jgi:hypothetical protein
VFPQSAPSKIIVYMYSKLVMEPQQINKIVRQ